MTSTSPRVVIAPDSFKGHAAADEAASWLAQGVRETLPHADIAEMPMADGGEGTAQLFDGAPITLPTTDAAGRLTEASYTFDAANQTAIIDIAAASGLPAVADHPVPMTGDTYGTGVLIADAHSRGAHTIVLGLGGSATIDGGTGILAALGATGLDRDGLPVRPGGGHVGRIDSFDTSALNIAAAAANFVLLTDVDAPATGPHGAAAVFGPQKGATPAQVELLDAALSHLCTTCDIDPTTPGYGAAGGIAIGLTWLSRLLHGTDEHIRLAPGAEVVAASHGLPAALEGADLAITGEGRLDDQSFRGKVVGTVAAQCGPHTRLAVVCAFADTRPPGVDIIEVDRGAGTRDQLIDAGRRAAEGYLRTSTHHG
ncbi:glycerate kinase [Corynebacterium uberis]|uniref:glycerate kinase n=1 Tax=Corynebacterium TaxID=1716 RepID=UPI001D0AB7D2|nr:MULTISPECIES: glycerate kinase [Corynebacterium]MCZ9308375.1 glycerate kinase [Corynebacterium sp. c6VSa_13]UDL74046.1 glycerate kinase [Corynebacterium uberis]UDL75070.1 glycerate kinase [Corynebacterium uberis]UDL77283.1 glycerate kinase [Corynebacterium uberis]UDL79567.1 glycerate kinase [Corynebacterium uberis]